ncbi:MAG: GAF domain-containing protein [Elusimicrobiota bacterium]
MLGTYHMGALLDALEDLHHIHEEAYLYQFVLNRASDVLKAQGGTLFSVREDLGELIPEASKGVSLSLLKEIPFKTKVGISGWCATNQKPLLVENVQNDERFNRAVDVITGVRTRSIIAVPIIRQNQVYAVIELVNRVDGIFRDPDLQFLQHLANQIGIALENCRLYRQTAELLIYTNSVLNSLSSGFISTDPRGIVTRCNAAACRILSINADNVLKKPLLQAIPQYTAFSAILDITQKHQAPVARQEIELQKPDGSPMLIGYHTFLIRSDSQIHGAGILFQDISHLRKKT